MKALKESAYRRLIVQGRRQIHRSTLTEEPSRENILGQSNGRQLDFIETADGRTISPRFRASAEPGDPSVPTTVQRWWIGGPAEAISGRAAQQSNPACWRRWWS